MMPSSSTWNQLLRLEDGSLGRKWSLDPSTRRGDYPANAYGRGLDTRSNRGTTAGHKRNGNVRFGTSCGGRMGSPAFSRPSSTAGTD